MSADKDYETSTYLAIDLKSFYASVECIERGLDPLDTNLVVADSRRTEKTICLAVSPSLKAYKISGRVRLFEVIQKVKEVNANRLNKIYGNSFSGESYFASELDSNPELKLGYITAPPQMSKYMKYSTQIYNIYLKYFAPEDIHVYSIDEVFIDATPYIKTYGLLPRDLLMEIINEVLYSTGITATAGIGTNLYLCKIAMDIVAKHIEADENGVRIAELNEMSYRRILWNHRPLTDFWRIGKGYASRLEKYGIHTMGDIARCSLGSKKEYYNEDLLYKLFGINAELLIDHAWGWEPCTMKAIKSYKPSASSICSGQVLQCPYSYEKTKLIVKEMTELLTLDLIDKRLVTNQIVLTIGYDRTNLDDKARRESYKGEVTIDYYGRAVPKHAHGTTNLGRLTSSTKLIAEATIDLYERIIDKNLFSRRITISANNVVSEDERENNSSDIQLNLFSDFGEGRVKREQEEALLEEERRMQKAIVEITKKFGKNAVLKGMNLEEGGTTIERNSQIGGHRA